MEKSSAIQKRSLHLLTILFTASTLAKTIEIKVTLLIDPDHLYAQSVLDNARRDIANSNPSIAPEFSFRILVDNSKCTSGIESMSSLAILSQNYYQDNTQAVFGPTCYGDVSKVAGLTVDFDLLQFNLWADVAVDYETSNIVQMMTRSTFNIGENILATLKAADWNQIAIINCFDCYPEASDVQSRQYNVSTYLSDRGISILAQLEISKYWDEPRLADAVGNLSQICRVILPLIGGKLLDYVPFLKAMNSTGHLNAEYSILIILWDYQIDRGLYPWEGNPTMLTLFNRTYVLENDAFDKSRVQQFVYQNNVGSSANLLQTLELYESLFVYANILHTKYESDHSGQYNATTLRNLITFIQGGPFGVIFFSNNTQRIAPFSLAYINDSGYNFITKLDVDRDYASGKEDHCLNLNLTGTNLHLREDIPACGFKGEMCDQTGTVCVIFIMIAAVALCIGIFFSFRKIKHIESMQMPWAIAYSTLKFIDLDISAHGSQQLSILSLNEHMETKVGNRLFV